MCINGKWYSVCAQNWNGKLSHMACKDVGYSTGCKHLLVCDSPRDSACEGVLLVAICVSDQIPSLRTDNEVQLAAELAAVLLNCTGEEGNLSECSSMMDICLQGTVIHLQCISKGHLIACVANHRHRFLGVSIAVCN